MLDNFQYKTTLMRDVGGIIFIAMGIYSHKSTLVNRFITYERSQLMQRQLSKVFQEQPDGLLVLKQRKQNIKVEEEKTVGEITNKKKTTVEMI